MSGVLGMLSLLDSLCVQALGQLKPILPSSVPMWNRHEDVLKWAFVQLETGTALLLCITLKEGLRT